ncbi:MAG: GerW family sporulation protein [Eubacterium sp.]|nr:GerW family sporulation protein [Eubacterium sp.]
MAKNNFDETVNSLFKGLNHVMSTKTVVGEPQFIGDTTIIPLMDVSFGMGAGANNKDKSDSGTGGIGGKMSPSAVLVIKDNQFRVVNVKNQDAITKIIDMVPGAVNNISNVIKGFHKGSDPEVDAIVEETIKADSVREEIKNE